MDFILLSLASSSSSMNSVVEFITVLCIFGFVLLATYFATRWLAGYQKNKTAVGNLQVIEVTRLPNNCYMAIVRTGEKKYSVVAIGKTEVSLITTLTEEDLKESVSYGDNSGSGSFAEILSGLKKKLPTREPGDSENDTEENEG